MSPGAEPLGALLFVRHAAELSRALVTVNAVLARRRRAGPEDPPVRGVLVDARLERATPRAEWAEPGRGLAIGESVGVAGLWTLAWFVGRDAPPPDEPRARVLDGLLREGERAANDTGERRRWVFFPVLHPAEEPAVVDRLAGRYPELAVARDVLLDDPREGLFLRGDPGAAPNVFRLG